MRENLDPRKRNPDGTYPDDQTWIDGKPYRVVERVMVKRIVTVRHRAPNGQEYSVLEEHDSHIVGRVVPG